MTAQDLAIVQIQDGNLVTNSLAIADGVGNPHATVIKLIRENVDDLQEFGNIGFQIQNSTGPGRPTEYAVLNEQHATLLMTYMRNSDVVKAFKKRLVKAFYDLSLRARVNTALPPPEQTITPADQNTLTKLVAGIANNNPRMRARVWARFNNHFRLGSYRQLPAARMPEAIKFLDVLATEFKTGAESLSADDMFREEVQHYEDSLNAFFVGVLDLMNILPVEFREKVPAFPSYTTAQLGVAMAHQKIVGTSYHCQIKSDGIDIEEVPPWGKVDVNVLSFFAEHQVSREQALEIIESCMRNLRRTGGAQ